MCCARNAKKDDALLLDMQNTHSPYYDEFNKNNKFPYSQSVLSARPSIYSLSTEKQYRIQMNNNQAGKIDGKNRCKRFPLHSQVLSADRQKPSLALCFLRFLFETSPTPVQQNSMARHFQMDACRYDYLPFSGHRQMQRCQTLHRYC